MTEFWNPTRRARYVIKQKDGRRNRYQIQAHLPLPEAASQEPAIGEVLAVLAGARDSHRASSSHPRTLVEPRPSASAWPA